MPPTPSLAKAGGATLPSYSTGKCPYCGQMFHQRGGGVANHIWRTPSCRRKKHKLLRSLASATIIPGQDTEEHHDVPSSGQDDSNLSLNGTLPGLDNFSLMNTGMHDNRSDSDSAVDSSAWPFCVIHNQENARFIYPGCGKTLLDQLWSQEQDGKPYAPWTSKLEWELAHWLSTSQLSQSNIDSFLKLQWVSVDS
jgi:hypothetical protein